MRLYTTLLIVISFLVLILYFVITIIGSIGLGIIFGVIPFFVYIGKKIEKYWEKKLKK